MYFKLETFKWLSTRVAIKKFSKSEFLSYIVMHNFKNSQETNFTLGMYYICVHFLVCIEIIDAGIETLSTISPVIFISIKVQKL